MREVPLPRDHEGREIDVIARIHKLRGEQDA